MDGFKARLSRSIQLQLAFWISGAILVIAAMAGTFSYVSAFDEAHELQDDVLRQVADTFNRHHLQASVADADRKAKDGEDAPRVWAQFLPSTDAGGLALPADLPAGMHTLKLKDGAYRVFVKVLSSGERLAVAQDATFRDGIARDNAKRTVMPFLLLAPVLLVLVAALVRRIFRPVAELAEEIDRRGERDLHPLVHRHLAGEIRPFVSAINGLLERVKLSMEAQQRFVADAAHELRSPLTAMSLQAERLANAPLPDEARERLSALRQGIERGRHLLEQLLQLARAQAVVPQASGPVSVQQIFRELLEDLMPLAQARQIDLGVAGNGKDALINVGEAELKILVRNLVDNAIRYTPAGGRVDLAVCASQSDVLIRVSDTGPGIAVAERERAFDPFYRIVGNGETGSGLGLSIARTIADRIGADIRLTSADEESGQGLCVSLRFAETVIGNEESARVQEHGVSLRSKP